MLKVIKYYTNQQHSAQHQHNTLITSTTHLRSEIVQNISFRFLILQTYDVGHAGKLTGIVHNPGALITCSTDRTIQVAHPTNAPQNITTLNQQNGEMTRVSL